MWKRENRRSCGFALGMLVSWGGANLLSADEPQPLPLPLPPSADEPKVSALESAPLASKLADSAAGPVERVVERYPNRLVKIERHVTQDADGNYFNHGPWTKWSEAGTLMGQGEFRNGAQHGRWVRLYDDAETREAYAAALELGFEAPFSSVAEFDNGRLHGTWVVLDAKKRQVSAVELDQGVRHGKSLAWHPNGKKFREIEYRAGEFDGAAVEYDVEERVVKQEKFVHGYRHGLKREYYGSGEVRSECETLFAKQVVKTHDDWWNGTSEVEVVGTEGYDQRHGRFVAWNLDGLKVLEGSYVDDVPEGKFTWWHENGTKAIEGSYVHGKQDGTWTWWYSNGMKELTGDYVQGEEVGNWKEWQETGLVAKSAAVFETELYEATEAVDLQPIEVTPTDEPAGEVKTAVGVEGNDKVDQTTAVEIAKPETMAKAEEPTNVAAATSNANASALQVLFPTSEAVQLEPADGAVDIEEVEVSRHPAELPRPLTPSIRAASLRTIKS
jgi:antitoxin component YwqK of YwqJK toxin-antitoxin module